MKFNILAPIGAITLLTVAATTTVLAQDSLDEIVVTASPHGKSIDEITGSVSVLDNEALQREVASTLGETLKNQLGVHSSSFGPGVGVPVIRGQSGQRVEVLQNGTTVARMYRTQVLITRWELKHY